MALDIYQAVTDRILEMLDKGTVPWRHPSHKAGGGLPKNLESDKPYRGVNVFLLGITSWLKGYDSAYWMTYRQALEQGGHVKRGEKSSMVVFWKKAQIVYQKTEQVKTIPVLRYYNVFNANQISDLNAPDAPPAPQKPFEPIEEAEKIVAGYADGPKIEHTGSQAFYLPNIDLVRMPVPERFVNSECFYATEFHELVHSTGHTTRLNRNLSGKFAPFGSPDYSKEELIAEMGSAFLCAAAGISPATIEQSATYIDGWRKRISDDPRLVIAAAGAGQRASDWIRAVPQP
jgi:antirestriction protein ArdC